MTTQLYTVQLTHEDWQRVVACMSLAPWREVNTLLMNVSEQLQKQIPINKQTNHAEMPINIGETSVKQ